MKIYDLYNFKSSNDYWLIILYHKDNPESSTYWNCDREDWMSDPDNATCYLEKKYAERDVKFYELAPYFDNEEIKVCHVTKYVEFNEIIE